MAVPPAFMCFSKFVLFHESLRLSKLTMAVGRRSMAGHSKWANIKFKKMHRDIARAKILGRLHKEIVTAVRENGPDPALNIKLEHLIERAKATNMAKDKIESAIKSGVKNTGDVIHNLLIEGHGPGGCGILVDTLTSNKIRTRTEVKTLFTKNGEVPTVDLSFDGEFFCGYSGFPHSSELRHHRGHVGDEGSVSFLYEHKGVINIENTWVSLDSEQNKDEDLLNKAEELAIYVGAEEVQIRYNADNSKFLQFICAPSDLIQVSNKLTKENDCTLLSANLEYIPRVLVELNENLLEKVHKLLERINEHEDVVKTYDNIQDYPSDT